MYYSYLETPIGKMTLQATDDGVAGAWFEMQTTEPSHLGQRQENHPVLVHAKKQLQEYFEGKRFVFDIPLAAQGTPFQMNVWQALTQIDYGKTCSYQDIADSIHNPKAVRAIGLANGKNPISVIVPCHRVIGKNGKLTGYAGGIERKAWLLEHEEKHKM